MENPERFAQKPQRGKSCSYQCFHAFLRHSMPLEEYKAYRVHEKTRNMQRTIALARGGGPYAKTAKELLKESVDFYLRYCEKNEKSMSPDQKGEMKKNLQDLKQLGISPSTVDAGFYEVGTSAFSNISP